MTEPMSAEAAKRKSRGWSDAMDSAAIAKRLAIVEELNACWKSLQKAREPGQPAHEAQKSAQPVSFARNLTSPPQDNNDESH